MATKEFKLTEIKKGDNICWFVASQSYYCSTIRLYDDKGNEYFKLYKETRNCDFHVVGQGYADFTGNELFLSVDILESDDIKQSITANNVTDSNAGKIGQVYAFCFEDANDEDFNDLYINITGWDKKG